MKFNKIIQRKVRRNKDGVNVAADVTAAITANVNESGSRHTHVSSHQRVVQRDGKTVVSEQRTQTSEDDRGRDGAE